MEIISLVFRQILVMFIYILIGAFLFKKGKITKTGSKELANVLIYLILPAVIIKSFCIESTPERWIEFAISGVLGCAALVLAIIFARLFFPKAPIANFAAAFSNAGFMGIPLVQVVLGAHASFFLIGFVALLNILQWTYGVSVMTGQKAHVKIKAIVFNPIMISLIIGVAIFSLNLSSFIPQVVSTALNGISLMNAPVAMIILGVYVAQANVKEMLLDSTLYKISAVRLVLIPLITIALFALFPMVSKEIKIALVLVAAAPVGTNVAIYAQIHKLDYVYACKTVVMSTILSAISLPVLAVIANAFF